MSDADIDKVLATDAYLTLVPHGNLKVMFDIAEKAMKAGKLGKLLAGSNTPKDGYTVLGTWVIVAALADKFQDVHPANFICLASGNVADAYGLDHGKLAVGYKLDLDFLGNYGYDPDAMGTLKAGMIPASGCMVLDGKMQMTRHKNVPALLENPKPVYK
jgi:enamidase